MKNQLFTKKGEVFLVVFIILISGGIYLYPNQNNSENIKGNKEFSQKEVISEPKEYRVVAEEILYPEEYDFGDEISSITAVVGTPIKFNALQITKVNINDTIELEFDGKRFNAQVFNIKEKKYSADKTGDLGEVTTFRFDSYIDPSIKKIWKNQIDGRISYNKYGVVDGEIRIQDKGGDYVIYINNDVAYYVLEDEWRKEFYRQGNTID
jgi:hypothetical protein